MGPFDFIKQAKKFQEAFKNMQDEMAAIEFVGESGAGLVTVTVNSAYKTIRVTIDDSLMKENKKVLEELIQAAACDAAAKVERTQKDKMGGMMSGFGLPLNSMFPFMPGGKEE